MRSCPAPSDAEKEASFAKAIDAIYARHGATLITMAKGAHELRNKLNMNLIGFAEMDDIQSTLDEFYMSRIGIRMVRNTHTILLAVSTVFFFFFVAYWSVSGTERTL